jgi:hypothetical protein
LGIVGAMKMNCSKMKDERLLAFYENIRRQVDFDTRAGGRYRLAGEGVKQYADRLREEIDQRQLRFIPINWPRELPGMSHDKDRRTDKREYGRST